jgi:hypothetical protein
VSVVGGLVFLGWDVVEYGIGMGKPL